MPAVKKELPGREDLALALATFHPNLAALPLPPLPGYLAPLPAAAALPPAASLPAASAGYESLLAPPLRAARAYLSLHEAAPHLHLPRDPLALERFSAPAAAAPDFQPLLDNGEPCIEVECGANRALLYVRKLCQGSKGPSIRHRGEWLTPNEFQFVSGRETAKDWKRSIRHKGAAASGAGARAAAVPPFLPGDHPPHPAISAPRGRCDSGAAAGAPPPPWTRACLAALPPAGATVPWPLGAPSTAGPEELPGLAAPGKFMRTRSSRREAARSERPLPGCPSRCGRRAGEGARWRGKGRRHRHALGAEARGAPVAATRREWPAGQGACRGVSPKVPRDGANARGGERELES